MSTSQRITQQQNLAQQQSLSPLQVRYFKMLEMNSAQAEDEVRRALDENPALEVADNHGEQSDNDTFNETAEQMQLADYATEDDIPFYRLNSPQSPREGVYDSTLNATESTSLLDWLGEQLSELTLTPEQQVITKMIAGSIDDNGYLTRSIDAMADDLTMLTGRDVTREQVKESLDIVRTLEPAGVGAFDLRDCLLLQLKRMPRGIAVDHAREIIADYFDIFSKKHYNRLGSLLHIDRSELRQAISLIRTLNPKPGSAFAGSDADDRLRHIIPDFNLDVDGERFHLSMADNLPELQIERSFLIDESADSAISPRHRSTAAADFIRRQRDEARGFIGIVRSRRETLMRIATAIVTLQRDFFLSGNDALLRPMILKDVSALTGDDPSVVSRATQGKYIATPWGIFSLKHFFNERFSGDSDISSREIMAAIKEIIDHENPHRPLSDEAIKAALAEQGHAVARRTITKYREQMGLPVARLRRQL